MARGDRIRKAEERWKQLVSVLDSELQTFRRSRYQMGKILYEIKVFLGKYGWDKGRAGRWKPLLKERKIAVSTANDLVRDYEDMENLPASQRFFAPPKPRISHKNRKKKGAETAPFTQAARVEPAPDKLADNSSERRQAVECIFVLTLDEKDTFMRSVKMLGPLQATQVMYKAAVAAAEVAKGAGA